MPVTRRTFMQLAAAGLASAAVPLINCAEGQSPVAAITTHLPTRDQPLTPTQEWYYVALSGAVEADMRSYRLLVGGTTRNSLRLSLAQLQERFEVVEMPLTLACVGNIPGGHLFSSSIFRGVRLVDVMDAAGVSSRATGVVITGLDGYLTYRALSDIRREDTLLAFAMGTRADDMEPLPIAHGFPLRILTPGYYGYVQPKWLSSLQFVDDHDHVGVVTRSVAYAQGKIQLVSGFSRPAYDGWRFISGNQGIFGYAYGDGRRIASIEISVDGGPWTPTQLAYNGPDDDLPPGVWAIWYYDWAAVVGKHSLSLRATYDDGETQFSGRDFPYSGGSVVTFGVEVVAPGDLRSEAL